MLGKGLGSLIPLKSKTGSAAHLGTLEAPVTAIKSNPSQPRQNFSEQELKELADSIRVHGILQPLLVSEQPDGSYELIAGERRLRAAKMIGLATVPVNIKQATDHEKLELALVENIQRADLNPLERAFAFKRLVDEFELHPTEIARRIGVGHATVTNSIRLLQLPQEMKAALQDGSITEGQARAILGLPGEKHMLEAFAELKNRKMSVREVEHSVRIRKIKLFGGGGIMHDPILLTYEEKLRQTLGTKVLITQKGGKSNGKIIIEYFSPAELKNLVNKLTSIISSQ